MTDEEPEPWKCYRQGVNKVFEEILYHAPEDASGNEERELRERYRRGDSKAREALIERHLPADAREARETLVLRYFREMTPFISEIAKRVNWVQRDIVVQAGAVGLIKAVDRFDPDRGYQFSTYARHWIRAEILREPEVKRGIPRHYRIVKRAHDDLMAELEHQPSVEEIAERAGVTAKQVEEWLNALAAILSDPLPEADDGSDTLPDEHGRDLQAQAMLVVDIEMGLRCLEERERRVLTLTYWEDMSDQEIGKRLKLTPNHVNQVRFHARHSLGGLLNFNIEETRMFLTELEIQVVSLTLKGVSDEEIARMLELAPDDIPRIRHSAVRKLGEWFHRQQGGEDYATE